MGRHAIITGGSSGIGRYLVSAFASAGYNVAFTHVDQSAAADEVIGEAGASGGHVRAFSSDVGDGEAVSRLMDEASDWFGDAPDVLVNNAGIQTWSPLLDLSEERWDAVIRTNLKGCFLNTREAGKRMVAAGKGGSIINIGSGCNKHAFPGLVDYTASKGGVEQFTKVAAVELGPHGIRVNCVAPGAIETERTLAEAQDYGETWGRVTPLRRVGTPADIAGPVLFLAGEQAGFITGQTLWVDGGVFTQAFWPYQQ
ncbi:beta-ketoacyl-ACP reductase [Ciceribacter naphthalenivorans]|uniref:Beta-ketoacyl-ACP reductase n=2 Tax=Alphaproteobacteria TaxID=28211 RepID=A0A512HCM9_9HYPH|nr:MULTISPECIES: SDR family NAD(P)-dependent oxidoreductase [Alphaproteobacteria]GEO83206.1 beta-ketoacyl-ACP reductase [Ciceribacter naphthalenivorans]GLR20399.1 beta-ketoacyl-ACP reductase [Ciceribacter naphthalenivorans]GLT03255.1 beta-ketoacyl-ACP reductase [Sphingomonas psychrolutea]